MTRLGALFPIGTSHGEYSRATRAPQGCDMRVLERARNQFSLRVKWLRQVRVSGGGAERGDFSRDFPASRRRAGVQDQQFASSTRTCTRSCRSSPALAWTRTTQPVKFCPIWVMISLQTKFSARTPPRASSGYPRGKPFLTGFLANFPPHSPLREMPGALLAFSRVSGSTTSTEVRSVKSHPSCQAKVWTPRERQVRAETESTVLGRDHVDDLAPAPN